MLRYRVGARWPKETAHTGSRDAVLPSQRVPAMLADTTPGPKLVLLKLLPRKLAQRRGGASRGGGLQVHGSGDPALEPQPRAVRLQGVSPSEKRSA